MSNKIDKQNSLEEKRVKNEEKLRMLKPDLSTKVNLQNHPTIHEYGKLVLVGPSGVPVADFTIMHPIGISNLPTRTWVMAYSDDVHAGLQRLKDPMQERINESRWNLEVDMLSTAGLVKSSEPHEVIVAGMKNIPYAEWKNPAKAKMAVENAKLHSAHDEKHKSVKGQKPKFRPETNLERFYTKEEASFALKVDRLLTEKELFRVWTEKAPQTFQTELGKGKKFPQTEVHLGPDFQVEKNTLTGVLDEIQRQIFDQFVEGGDPKSKGIDPNKNFMDPRVELENTKKSLTSALEKCRAFEEEILELEKHTPSAEMEKSLNEALTEIKRLEKDCQNNEADLKYFYNIAEENLKDDPDTWKEMIQEMPSKKKAEE